MNTENRAIEDMQRSRQVLVADLKRIVGDAEVVLKRMAGSTQDELASTRDRFDATLSQARERLDEARLATTRKLGDAALATNTYVRENPWQVVGVASLIGLAAAFLLYRRSGD